MFLEPSFGRRSFCSCLRTMEREQSNETNASHTWVSFKPIVNRSHSSGRKTGFFVVCDCGRFIVPVVLCFCAGMLLVEEGPEIVPVADFRFFSNSGIVAIVAIFAAAMTCPKRCCRGHPIRTSSRPRQRGRAGAENIARTVSKRVAGACSSLLQ